MFDLMMSESPPSDCFLKQLEYIFPNPKDLPLNHELFDMNKYTIPSQAQFDMVNKGVSKETFLFEDKKTKNSDLWDVFTPLQVYNLKNGIDFDF